MILFGGCYADLGLLPPFRCIVRWSVVDGEVLFLGVGSGFWRRSSPVSSQASLVGLSLKLNRLLCLSTISGGSVSRSRRIFFYDPPNQNEGFVRHICGLLRGGPGIYGALRFADPVGIPNSGNHDRDPGGSRQFLFCERLLFLTVVICSLCLLRRVLGTTSGPWGWVLSPGSASLQIKGLEPVVRVVVVERPRHPSRGESRKSMAGIGFV
ncbi:unnamed protein product [Thlaspi arvense]|uniref:Uncharacterized protein n=1 Tax=Thlaspi arvense TaxID=13288 RepID=A0AAU9STU5_THLAR|nr:unnamed protein product [Thlaspi arvense]